MKNKNLIAGLIFLFSLTATVFSQTWFTVQGRWARVEYHREHKVIADSLLKMAEVAIPRLARMHGLPLSALRGKQVRIILTSAPDVTNGYALDRAVVIYALSSMYIHNWAAQDSWYKMVLTHELAHYVTFIAVKRKLNWFGQLANLTVPRWFYEGIAQYFAEKWNTYRGDIFLKDALLSGRLTYHALENLEDGRLLYAAGHGFVRYLAATYGDSSLMRLMGYKKNGWYLDFDDAFKAVYDKSPEDAFRDFTREMVIYYGSLLVDYPELKKRDALPSFGYRDQQVIPLGDSTYIVAARLEKPHQFNTAFIARIKKGKTKIQQTITNHFASELIVSPDARFIAYGRWDVAFEDDQTRRSLRWFVYDRTQNRTRMAAKNIRAQSAAFDEAGNLYLVEQKPTGSRVWRFENASLKRAHVFTTPMPIGDLTVRDGRLVFVGQRANAGSDLFLWQKGRLTALTQDTIPDRRPFFVNDSLIVFNRYPNDLPALALFNLKSRKMRLVEFAQDALFLQGLNGACDSLVVRYLKPNRKYGFFTIPVDSLLREPDRKMPPYRHPRYARWKTKLPQPVNLIPLPDTPLVNPARKRIVWPQFPLMHILSFALPTYDEKAGLGIYGSTVWLEALYRQMIGASFILFPDSLYQSLVSFQHQISMFSNRFTTVAYHGPIFFSDEGNPLDFYHSLVAFQWQKPFYIQGNSRLSFLPAVDYVYSYNRFRKPDPSRERNFKYSGPTVSFEFKYLLPTRYFPAVAKRYLHLSGRYFKSLSTPYRFSVLQLSAQAGINLILEELGLKTRIAYLRADGKRPPLKSVGIDKYFEYDLPRDYTYTRTIRGLRQNIYGTALLWNSTELTYFLQERSGLKLLALPMNNLAISLFGDYARVQQRNWAEVYSYGAEFSFGENGLRLGAGYARVNDLSRQWTNHYFLRLSVTVPE